MKKQIALVLAVVMLLALVAIPASAAGYPNPGVGTTYTELSNKEGDSASASIMYYNTSGGTIAGPNRTIPGNGSISIDPDSTQLPQNFVGSAVVSSNKRLASVVQTEWEGGPGDGFQMGLYSGVAAGSSAICFPSLWKYESVEIISSFAVQNTGTSPVNVDLSFVNRAGVTVLTDSDTIPAGAQHTFDLAQLPNIPADFEGSANVTVNGEGSVAGVAVASWGGASSRSATYNAADCSSASGPTVLVVPTQFRVNSLSGWVNGLWSAINVQNLSGNTATLKLTYTDRDGGTPPLVLNGSIPPFSTIGANTRNGGNFAASDFAPLDVDQAWAGTVKVEVSEPAVATVVTQWDRTGGGEAGVYAAADQSAGATKVFVPGVKRIMPSGTWQDFSAVIVQNLGSGTADVTVEFFDAAGTSLLTFSNDSIAPGAGLGYNTRNGGDKPAGDFNALGDNYVGQAVVTSNNGQPLSVVLNGISWTPAGGSGTTNGVAD